MFQEEFTYHNVLKYLTDEAKNDFNKFNDNESDLEGNFKMCIRDRYIASHHRASYGFPCFFNY